MAVIPLATCLDKVKLDFSLPLARAWFWMGVGVNGFIRFVRIFFCEIQISDVAARPGDDCHFQERGKVLVVSRHSSSHIGLPSITPDHDLSPFPQRHPSQDRESPHETGLYIIESRNRNEDHRKSPDRHMGSSRYIISYFDIELIWSSYVTR